MDNFESIKTIWNAETGASLPDANAITKKVKQHQQKQSRRMLWIVAAIILLLILFIWIISGIHFELWTTRAGAGFFVICGLYMVWMKYRTYRNKKNHELLDNEQYLETLKEEKINDFTKVSSRQLTAFLLWISAAALYFYEGFSSSAIGLLIGYGSLLLFSLLVWLVYRPYMKKLYWKKNQRIMDQIENLKKQTQ